MKITSPRLYNEVRSEQGFYRALYKINDIVRKLQVKTLVIIDNWPEETYVAGKEAALPFHSVYNFLPFALKV